MKSTGNFTLEVDVPFPLNVTPKPVVESAGNVAVQRTLSSLMDTLCTSVVRDHINWTKAQKTAQTEKAEAFATAAA